MNEDELYKVLQKEEEYAFSGWDFSHLNGRCKTASLSWDYKTIVEEYLKDEIKILNKREG